MCLKITATGDIFPSNMGYHSKIGIGRDFYNHRGQKWERVFIPVFSDSDICIVNLEAPLIHDADYCNTDYFAGSIAFAHYLKHIGVTHANVANNHILEQGLEGFYKTIDALKKAGIEPIGLSCDGEAQVSYYESKGYSIGIAAFNDIHDIQPCTVYADYSESSVLEALEKMKSTDVNIVVLHWGSEYTNIPSLKQLDSAERFIEAGADFVIGHHPHVVQPVIKYKDGVIAFSLGNCLFDMYHSPHVREGCILRASVRKGIKEFECLGILNTGLNELQVLDESLIRVKLDKYESILCSWRKKSSAKFDSDYEVYSKRKKMWNRVLMKIDLLRHFRYMSKQDVSLIIARFFNCIDKCKRHKEKY